MIRFRCYEPYQSNLISSGLFFIASNFHGTYNLLDNRGKLDKHMPLIIGLRARPNKVHSFRIPVALRKPLRLYNVVFGNFVFRCIKPLTLKKEIKRYFYDVDRYGHMVFPVFIRNMTQYVPYRNRAVPYGTV